MEQQLKQMVDFLHEFDWIYNFKLTDFFIDEVWENIPGEWAECLLSLSHEQLNQLPFGYMMDTWPVSFREFLQKSISFSSSRNCKTLETAVEIDPNIKRGMNPKKQHEVSKMAALVHDLVKDTGSDVIVDVGSGLGYLGQTLNKTYGHTVVGIEGKQSHTTGADKRVCSVDGVINITCELDNSAESMDNFKYIIKNLSDQGIIQNNRQSKARDITSADASGHIESADDTPKSHDNFSHDIGILKSDYLRKSSSSYLTDDLADNLKPSTAEDDCGCHGNKHSEIVCNSVDGCHTHQSSNSGAISKSRHSISSNNDRKPSICGNFCHGNRHTEKNSSSHRLNIGSMDNLTNDEKTSNICDACALSNHGDENHDFKNVEKMSDSCQNCVLSNYKHDHTNVNKTSHESCPLSEDKQTCDTSAPGHDFPSILMIGLHCCGDLTPTMMKFFSGLDNIKGLCCVSCCYHRMKYDETQKRFDNFPLSSRLKTVLENKQTWSLNSYAMRLAAQETRSRWRNQTTQDHEYHIKNVAYRGILEVFIKQESCDHSKLFRKLTRKGDMATFSTYVEAIVKRTTQNGYEGKIEGEKMKGKLEKIYSQYEKYFMYIEPFTALQVLMQPVLETLIYLDRLMWLEEHTHRTSVVSVFDDSISPRNLALIAVKT
ncbi:probable methyltransferase-like protein 25 [Mytilus trossulus]|uniref:probable methyltransferase-like protein 25 n=1 Tax=Mytilus trossulus TaxID=6551 RepID=UPI0030041942